MPASSVAISVEGVLQKYQPVVPIPIGIALYHSLASNFNILLYSEGTKKELDYWLSIEALNKHAAVEYNEDDRTWLAEDERKVSQVTSLRNRGFYIDLIIEPSPSASSLLLAHGYSVMTLTHAQYALPQWRPDYEEKKKSWDELEKAATRMAELRSLDTRMKDGEGY